MTDTVDADDPKPLRFQGGWCAVCGEPVIAIKGGDCPAPYMKKHGFVMDPVKTAQYPVRLPMRVSP